VNTWHSGNLEVLVARLNGPALETIIQMAHDIRSPLAALGMLARDLTEVSEEKRVLIRRSIDRIHEIANSLLGKRENPEQPYQSDSAWLKENGRPQLLGLLLNSIASEKKVQYRAKPQIKIEFKPLAASYRCFSLVRAADFERVVSNLIDNAVESLDEEGRVSIGVYDEGEKNIVSIADNGRGIPKQYLPRITEQGFTFGKPRGCGLGLYHARTTVEAMGGSLEIQSTEGSGTVINLILEPAEPPSWSLPAINLNGIDMVVVLDVDPLAHKRWQTLLRPYTRAKTSVAHFYKARQLRDWCNTNAGQHDLYLLGHELPGEDTNGFKLGESLKILPQCVLVSNYSEQVSLQNLCLRWSLKMIPKEFLSLVPIIGRY
jgi:hypothetical protein